MTGMDTALSMAPAASGRPQCIIVAGPNGAGKTTTALGLASEWHKVPRIVNPDEIAGGLSGAPELGALEAGKLALKAQARYMAHRQDVAHGGRGVPVTVVDPDAWADLQRATRTKTTIPPSRPRTP
jgi:hypothetical protein